MLELDNIRKHCIGEPALIATPLHSSPHEPATAGDSIGRGSRETFSCELNCEEPLHMMGIRLRTCVAVIASRLSGLIG